EQDPLTGGRSPATVRLLAAQLQAPRRGAHGRRRARCRQPWARSGRTIGYRHRASRRRRGPRPRDIVYDGTSLAGSDTLRERVDITRAFSAVRQHLTGGVALGWRSLDDKRCGRALTG